LANIFLCVQFTEGSEEFEQACVRNCTLGMSVMPSN